MPYAAQRLLRVCVRADGSAVLPARFRRTGPRHGRGERGRLTVHRSHQYTPWLLSSAAMTRPRPGGAQETSADDPPMLSPSECVAAVAVLWIALPPLRQALHSRT